MGPRFRKPAIILAALFLLSALARAQSVPGAFFPSTGDMWSNADQQGCGWVSPYDTPISIPSASGSINLTCTWNGGTFAGALTYTLPSATPPATHDTAAPYLYRFASGKTLPITVHVSGTWTHPLLSNSIVSLIQAESGAGDASTGGCAFPDMSGNHQDISSDTVDISITCTLTALETESDPKLVPHPMGWTTFSGNLWFFTGPQAQIKSFPIYEANIAWLINVYYDFAATPSVKIDHVELVQRTQTVSGGVNAMGVPLVATLPTLVRVFVAPGNSQAQPAVTGTLTVTYADKSVETKQGTTVMPVASPDRNNLSSSLNFYLLRPYYGEYHPGAAQFSVRLTTAAGQDLNVSQTFSAQLLGLSSTFSDYNIAYLPICYRGPGMITSSCPEGENLASWNLLFPLGRDGGGLDALPGPPLVWDIPLNSTAVLPMSPAAQRLNNAVLLLLFLEQCVAYLRPNYTRAFGGLPDLSYPVKGAADGLSVAWAQQISGADGLAWRSNVWHQLGRNLGLSTAGQPNNPIDMLGCGLPDAPNWPYQDSDIQQPGWGDWVMKLHPSTSHDIMSRCLTNTWLSPFSWDKLLNYFLANPISTIFPTSKPAVPAAAAATSFLLVSGIAGQNGAATSLSPVRTLQSGPADTSNPSGRYCVVTTGSAGQASSCFEPNFNLVDGDGTANQSPFSLVVPSPAGLKRVALTFQGSELAAIVASPNAPQVTITAPVANARWTTGQMNLQWNGTDADGDTLQYDVLYSSDGKTIWTPLTAGLQNTQFTVDAGNLVASNQTWFRVVALDGVNTGTADAGPIQVVNQASVAVSPATLDFGKPPVDTPITQTIQISNTGTGALRITAASADNPAFLPSLPPSGLWIVPGGSTLIDVDLNTSAAGAQSGTLSLTTNDPQQPKKTISLAASVTALPQPAISIDSTLLSFGQVNIGATAQMAFSITNQGYATLSIQSITASSAEFTVSAAGPFDVPEGGSRVVVSFKQATAGLKVGLLTIKSNDPNKPSATIALSATAVTSGGALPPFVGTGGVVDGAQFSTPVAPGGIASVFGLNLVGSISAATTVPLPTDLGVKVQVDGINAPLYAVYPGQINFQVPFETAVDHDAQVVVVRGGVSSSPVTVPVRRYAPAVFMNAATGDPIVTRYPDNTYITKSNPAHAGDILLVYVTGFGEVANPPATGAAAVAQPLPSTVDTVTATVGGVPVTVLYGGLTPASVGLGQVNIQLPTPLPAGTGNTLPLVISVAGFQNQTVQLPVPGGTATAPAISISPASLDFGSVTVGQTKQLAVTISNTGTAALNVTAATVTGAAFTWIRPTMPFTLAAGAQAAGAARFAPLDEGAQSGTLTIASSDPAHPSISAALTGTGAAAATSAPKLTVDQTSLAFGSVTAGQYKDLALTIGNSGTAALNVSSISSNNAAFRASVTTLTVAAGASTPISVRFTPTTAASQTGTLSFASNDPAGGGVSVALSGTGAVASLGFTPASLDFGSVASGQTKDLTLAISNSGTATLTVSSAASTNSLFTVQTPAPPYSIAAGAQQVMTIRFAPAAAGAQTGTLNLASNDAAHATTPVPLSGTGTSTSSGTPARPPGSVLDSSNPLSTSLAGLFLMNEARGATDSNIVDGQTASFAGANPPAWNSSDPSIVFNGGGYLNSYLNAGTDAAFDKLPVSQITLAAKVYVSTVATGGICEKNDGNASDSGFVFGWYSDGTLRFTVERSGQDMRVYTAPGSVPTGRWMQVAATWDGTVGGAASAHVFLDGVEQAKTTSMDGTGSLGYANATNQPFRIGDASFDVPGSFNGRMAYLAVYKGRILTPAEMSRLDAHLPIR